MKRVQIKEPEPYWQSPDGRCSFYKGDCLDLLPKLAICADVVCTDPPYFLSNDGQTIVGGKVMNVNKGEWDRSKGIEQDHEFNHAWIDACSESMSDDATLWSTGTSHNIYSVGFALQQSRFRVLNHVTWHKKAPPPNYTLRCIRHSSEQIVWAAKNAESKYYFDYDESKRLYGGGQMRDMWILSAAAKAEKRHGKHPTQKPVKLIDRMLAVSCPKDGLVLDPFMGSGTAAVVAARRGFEFVGIELDEKWLDVAVRRVKDERLDWGLAARFSKE